MRTSALSGKSLLKTAIIMLGMIMMLALSLFISNNQAKASFASNKPDLSISVDWAHWGSYADYEAGNLTVGYIISNGIGNDAYDVQITGATASNGVSLVTTTPVALGNISTLGSVTANLVYHVPTGVAYFVTNISGTAKDLSGTSYSYPQSSNLMDLAYIENTGGAGKIPSVDVLDMTTMSIVNKFEDIARTGSAQGHFISVSPDGRYIFHSEDSSTTTGYVEVLDAVTGVRVPGKYWEVGAGVGNLMTKLSIPGGHHYVFVTNTKVAPNGPALSVFDVEDQAYLGQISLPTGSAPHLIVASPDERTLWTYTGSGATSSAISFDISGITQVAPHTETLPSVIKDSVTIGGGLHAMVMHPNGKYLFMGSSTVGVAIVDLTTPTPTVVAIDKGGMTTQHNFTISPDATHLLIGEEGAYT